MKDHRFELLLAFYEIKKVIVPITLIEVHPEKQKMLYFFSIIQHSLVFNYIILDFYIDKSGDRK